MPDAIYFFIDGGYARNKYAEAMKQVFGLEAAELDVHGFHSWSYNQRIGHTSPQRFYYYDCLHDIKKDSETEEAFKKRVEQQNVTLDRIQALQGFHVRRGSLSGVGKKIRQKKVDVLLAVEMLDHSFRKNMTAAFLLAGDGDFVPLVEAVIRLGTWVQVFYRTTGASKELYSASDLGVPIGFDDLWSWGSNEIKEKYPLPATTHHDAGFGMSLPRNMKQGTTAGGEMLTLAEQGSSGEFFILVQKRGGVTLIKHKDRNALENYYYEKYGVINWL